MRDTCVLIHPGLVYIIKSRWVNAQEEGDDADVQLFWQIMAEDGPALWTGDNSDWVANRLMEKTIAELKCRQDRGHAPRDLFGGWEKNETHLAEHRPYLNNLATAFKRVLANECIEDCTEQLGMFFDPIQAPDFDDDSGISEQYENQDYLEEVNVYNQIMSDLGRPDLPGPTKPGGRGIPYDVMEFVPVFPTPNFNSRMDQLTAELLAEITLAEGFCPRADASIRGGRTRDDYWRNENFVDRTLEFILRLLALDPGLSRTRMLEIGRLFHSLILEPWYEQYGRRYLSPLGGNVLPPHEAENLRLRNAVIEMDNEAYVMHLQARPNFVDGWWAKRTFTCVLSDNIDLATASMLQVQMTARAKWSRFYSNWLQILANCELTRTKLTQEQLDSEELKMCPICADDYEVGHISNCPVWIECPNSHTLCLKCYTQLSLTPTKPYNDLMTTKYCPQCRGELEYENAMKNLSEGLGLMPTLTTDFAYGTVNEASDPDAPE